MAVEEKAKELPRVNSGLDLKAISEQKEICQ
jgi:hypothetical protein